MPERDRPKPAPVDASDVVAVGREFRAAVEGEDAVKAEALLLGAFDAGIDRATIEYWLYETCADHFLDFGHPLIYVVKAQELLPQVPDEYARDILAGIAFDIVYATREDTLPYWKGHADALAAIESTLPDIWAARSDVVPDGFDPVGLRDAVLDAPSSRDAVAAVHEALASNVPPIEVAKAVVGAGAHRVLRFDVEVEQDRDVAETWVWVTHRFTFASAVRNAVERFDSPDVLRLIFQAVAFIHTGRKMDEPPERRAFDRLETPASAGPDDVLAAVARRDIPAALGALRACLDGGRLAELRLRLEDLAFDDPYVRPIVVVHAIKTAFAAFEEYEALGDHPDAETALFAVVRFLASPVKERRVADAVYTSLRWVEDGVVPRKLTQ